MSGGEGVGLMAGEAGGMMAGMGDKLKRLFGALSDPGQQGMMAEKLAMTMDPSALGNQLEGPFGAMPAINGLGPQGTNPVDLNAGNFREMLMPVNDGMTPVPPAGRGTSTPLTMEQLARLGEGDNKRRDEILRAQMAQRAPAVSPQAGRGVGQMQQLGLPGTTGARQSLAQLLRGR